MSNRLLVTAAVAGALLIGALVGTRFSAEREPSRPIAVDAPQPTGDADRIRELETEVRRLKRQIGTMRRQVSETEPPPTRPASSDATAAEDDEVARRAAQIRRHAEATIRGATEQARRIVTAERAAEQTHLEDLARGGTMAFLTSLADEFAPPWETLLDADAYGALFERKVNGPTLAASSMSADTKLEDGTEIVFGYGRHDFDVGVLSRTQPIAKDLVVRGAGVDATAISLNAMIRLSGEVHSLTFRDLTIDTRARGDLERLRSAPYTLRLERCRVLGFDDGAGGSKMLGGREGAFYASDSHFVSGFGRSSGGGNLFSVGGVLLVRLERCTISGPIASVYQSGGRSALVFDECRFENVPGALRTSLTQPPPSVRMVNCTYTYAAAESRGKKRLLSELNGAWGD